MRRESRRLRVAISGAGIAGLTLALALAKKDIASTVFERADRLDAVGAGIQLSPNATRRLQGLGLASALNAVASAPRSIAIVDGLSARPIAHIPLGMDAERRYGAPYLVVHRADLQQLLVDACNAEAHIDIRLGATVAAFKRQARAVTCNGSDFDLLVGADGVHSALRNVGFGGQAPQDSGLVAWRAIVDMGDRPAFFERTSTMLCLGPQAHLVTYPIASGTKLNAVAIVGKDSAAQDLATNAIVDALSAKFPGWDRAVKDIFRAAQDWSPWPIRTASPLNRWTAGRIALIGDAAHAMLPFAAQGGAMAIEDAVSLADAVEAEDEAESDDVEGRLARWEAGRRRRVTKVAALASRNRFIYHLPQPFSAARDMAMRTLGPHRLLKTQDWIFNG